MSAPRARLRPWLGALCDAGCGLVLWMALSGALLLGGADTMRKLVGLQLWGLSLGALLVACGLGLLWPRPLPPVPWWRRSVVALLVVMAGALSLVALQLRPQPDPSLVLLLAVSSCVAALAAIGGLAMLEEAEAGTRLPARLALALLAGATLLFALITLRWPGPILAAGPVPSLVLLATVAAALLVVQWRAQGGFRAGAPRRRYWLVLVLLAGLPLLLAALLYLQPGWARVLWPLIAASVLAGTAVERLPLR